MAAGAFSAQQFALLSTAQQLFILNQLTNFPLYYLPGLRCVCGGDGDKVKFPCSISWMTRRGLPRMSTLVLWNLGWLYMLRCFFFDGDIVAMDNASLWRAAFVLQMYATGFVTVVLTPMKGPDVALGSSDALHCYAAMLYVFDHVVINEFVLGVSLRGSAFAWGFAASSLLCGVFQFLRADGDKHAKLLHRRCVGRFMRLEVFVYVLELGFMITENLLFFVFLLGMTAHAKIV